MAVKYRIEYLDIINNSHKLEIYDDNYVGSAIPVDGSVVVDYGGVDENLEPIRGQGLRVFLDANEDLTFSDLFSENEKTFAVSYFLGVTDKDGDVTFELFYQGWLNPEGFYEDFVNDKWVVSFDCVDGLGYLKDLAFVYSDGSNITGIKTQIEILSLALQRTGIQQDINVAINIFYTGLADDVSILENTKVDTTRYIKDDDYTVMNCEEVIKDLLETYGAVLISYFGAWYIYKPNELFKSSTATFLNYDFEGLASNSSVTKNLEQVIGTEANGFYPHHCSGNQSFTNKASFGALRITYKYGAFLPLLQNSDLVSNGVDYDFWTLGIINYPYLQIPAAGVTGAFLEANSSSTNEVPILTSDDYFVPAGAKLDFKSQGIAYFTFPIYAGRSAHRIVLTPTGGGADLYWNNALKVWDTLTSTFYLYYTESNDRQLDTLLFTTAAVPEDGTVKLVYYTPDYGGTVWIVKAVTLSLTIGEGDDAIEGDTWTFERADKPSARVPDEKEVLTGDDENGLYTGTLLKADGVTPTTTWYRKGVTEAVKIVEMLGNETMRMNANIISIYSGDVFGFFGYLSVITINGRSGRFLVTSYSYDTKNNIISAEFRQMFGDELTDLSAIETKDYGNPVKPTIKG